MSNVRSRKVTVDIRQATNEDIELSFTIMEDAMRPYVEATWGKWNPATQRHAHMQSFSTSSHWVVFANGEAVGVVAAELATSHVQLVKLYLRTQARGRGIGAVILSSLLKAAAERGQPLRLRVLAVNARAQAFYRRHGFRESSRTSERVFMEAKPNHSIEATAQSPLRALWAAPHVKR